MYVNFLCKFSTKRKLGHWCSGITSALDAGGLEFDPRMSPVFCLFVYVGFVNLKVVLVKIKPYLAS